MNDQQKKSTSKFLSLLLRHRPELIGLTLDDEGWADVDELLTRLAENDHPLDKQELAEIVATNEKKRFILNSDHSRIRANQGHSIAIDLNLLPQVPPDKLYHGTSTPALPLIKSEGLRKMERQHVHLSTDVITARNVGSRHGAPAVIEVKAAAMHADGFVFYLSDNGVWLTDHVPLKYLVLPDDVE